MRLKGRRGALAEPHPEEERCRLPWSKWSTKLSTRGIHSSSTSDSRIWDLPMQRGLFNNLATAQVRKDTPSLSDVKGLGDV